MLKTLIDDLGPYLPQVQILVSDNASSDQTPQILKIWSERIGNENLFRYYRQKENIGASRNVVSLFYEAKTPWLWFLGDDDRINREFLPELFEVLHGAGAPSACIMVNWNGQIRGGKTGFGTYTDALSLFYEYGNAWAAVVRRDFALQTMETRNLRSAAETTIWPQTIIGFMGMFDAQPAPVYFSEKPHGELLLDWPSVTNKSYWVRSLHDLLKAAQVVAEQTQNTEVKKRLLRWSTPGFLGHIRAIIRFSLIQDEINYSKNCQQMLASNYGFKGLLWSIVLWISDRKKLLNFLAMTAWCLRHLKSPAAFEQKVKALKDTWNKEREEAAMLHKRTTDLF